MPVVFGQFLPSDPPLEHFSLCPTLVQGEGDVTSVTAPGLQPMFPTHSPMQYSSAKVMSGPCSIPHKEHLEEVK